MKRAELHFLQAGIVNWRYGIVVRFGRRNSLEGKGNRLSPEELGLLAKELAAAPDPIEAARIKERLTRGFYGI